MFIMPSFEKSLIVEQFQGNYLKWKTKSVKQFDKIHKRMEGNIKWLRKSHKRNSENVKWLKGNINWLNENYR